MAERKKEGKSSMPRILLHLEGLVVLVGALIFYAALNGHWLLFILLFLVPDLSFLAYFAGRKTGSIIYNIVHSCVLPFILFMIGLLYDHALTMQIAVIWFAHIGTDRLVGYGLKYPNDFKTSHLSRV
jgi:hypothetical protein